jgi:hypothetical protein
MKFNPIIDDFFDLTKGDLAEIEIKQWGSEENCSVRSKSSRHPYKGFILVDKPQVKFCCEINFNPLKDTSRYIPRLTFFKIDKNFEVKETNKQKVIVNFDEGEAAENFWKLIGFISKFNDLVEVGDFDKSYSVVNNEKFIVEFDKKTTADKVESLKGLIAKNNFSDEDIKSFLKENRKKNLETFKNLLDDEKSCDDYKKEMGIKGAGEEVVWHHFLKQHHWLLGLNIDLRFIQDFIDEPNLGISNTDGKGSSKGDLLAMLDFIRLVELKTPNTKIFTQNKRSTSRTNTWSFSDDFIDGISQCLAQKTDWEKYHRSKDITKDNQVLSQDLLRTVDPKVIFIIGNKRKEIPNTSTHEDIIKKRDTFERFRRNNRNIDILTYDELFERAYYIVHNKPYEWETNEKL